MNIIEKQSSLQDAERERIESAVVRLAGDSGDGMQVTGGQFTLATALAGNDLATFPDYPAEIRAPTGTTFGVSSFQINFGSRVIKTSGDSFDVLVAMNPAALKVELPGLKPGGVILVDTHDFDDRHLRKAGLEANPLEDGTLDGYRVIELDISQLTLDAVSGLGLGKKEALRCKNFWALGYVYWMFARDRELTIEWLKQKFGKLPGVAESNIAALNAGHALAETAEEHEGFHGFVLAKAEIAP
ncbi:MAG: 2-oxoglutarate ferredoxin oxidoreductase subunit alpha, partial [Rhodospirillaceae bacterium]|nr:2-oxoglutarate ferredoxin oxidoreductase subunit alpha [Rhodospirillaceae bacterium]